VIVFITIPWFLPAYKAGGPIQSIANLVSNYSKDIEYYIFCSNKDLDGVVLKNVFFNQWIKYNSTSNVWVWYDTGVQTRLNLVKCTFTLKPDVLYAIGLFSLKYNILPLVNCHAKKKILSVRGMVHPGALSQKSLKKKIFLFLFNIAGIKKKISFHATDEEEAGFVKNQFGKKVKVFVASNFSKNISPQQPLQKNTGSLKLITVALISPMKNHLLVLNALANCKANIEYNIYGPIKDEMYWDQCVKQIGLLPSNIKVNYGGEVSPDKVEMLLSENHVFIMPSKSENFGHSLSEALSAAKPIITSNNTPWNFLSESKAGVNVETNETSIAKAISFFAEMSNVNYNEYVSGAKKYVENKSNLPLLKQQYQNMFSTNEFS
jgi:glycosyltransferase involved in cell wall biosynthesis